MAPHLMAPHRTSRRAARRRVLTTLLTVMGLVALATGVAVAFWHSSGAGVGTASTAALHAPTSVSASSTAGTGVVSISWSASVGTPAPTGYFVVRIDSGSHSFAACGTSVSSTITATTCSDSGVALGSYTYEAVAADHNWTATSAPSSAVTVAKANQSITFTSSAPVSATYHGATYTVTATGGGSGNPVAFTVDASATSVCSISGAVVSFVGVGTCVIDANQAGSTYYNAAPQAQQSFAVGQAGQTISYTSTAPANAVVGGTGYTPAATGGASGNPVTFTIDATTSTKCSISGGVVTFGHVGSCTVDANQAGNANYSAALQMQQSFAIGKGGQAITYTSTAPSNATVNGATYTVTATGGASGNAVTFTIDPSASAVCTLSGAVVSFVTGGTCVIDANQAGNADYLAASQLQQFFAVAKASQAISFSSSAPSGATVGGATYTPTASSTSGLGVTITVDGASSSVCSISAGVVSFTAAGTCTLDANQAGNASYSLAPQVQQSFAVRANQTITFPAISGHTYGDAAFSISATASSGLAVAFTSTTTGVCTVSGTTVTIVAAGTCSINADQGGNTSYNPAPTVTQSFTVAKASQTITAFTAPSAGAVGNSGTLSASASSGLAVTFTSATTSICTVAGSTVTYVAVGACTVNANQAGNGNYTAAPQVQHSITVSAQPTITTVSPSTMPHNGAITSVTINGTGFQSGLSVSLSDSNYVVQSVTIGSANQITVSIKNNYVDNGQHKASLTVTNPDGGTATKANAISSN